MNFFDDAIKASFRLDIALTKRGRHDGADIPMCGVLGSMPLTLFGSTYKERISCSDM